MSLLRNTVNYLQKNGLPKTLWRVQLEFRRAVLRPLVGRYIELTGNRGKLDNCTFLLNSLMIPPSIKSRFVSNVYESEMRMLIKKYLQRDKPVIEMGACIGVVSCITNSLLQHPKNHIVIEANPEIIPLLEANKKENKSEFKIVNAAIAYGSETVSFFIHKKILAGSVHYKAERSVTVPTVSLKHLLEESGFDHINLIVDIEGAEIPLIEKEMHLIKEHVDVLFMEYHPQVGPVAVGTAINAFDDKNAKHIHSVLLENGFVLKEYDDVVYTYERAR